MPREKESYRDNLEGIIEFLRNKYNDSRRFLSIQDVKGYTGRSYDFIHDHFGVDRNGISAEKFARLLS